MTRLRARLGRLLSSLQFRLTVGFAAVLALAIAGVSAYAAAETRAETERFTREVEESRAARVERLAQQAYDANRDWDQVRYAIGQAASALGWRVVIQDAEGAVLADTHEPVSRRQPGQAGVGGSRGQDQFFPFRPQRVQRRLVVIGNEEVGMMMFVDEGAPEFPYPARFDRRSIEPEATIVVESIAIDAAPGAAAGDAQTLSPFTPAVQAEIAQDLAPEPRLSQLETSFRKSLILAGGAAGAAGILLVGMFTRQALAPIRGLSGAAQRLSKGDLAYRVPVKRRDEIGELSRTFNDMAAGLEAAASQRKALTADIAHELRTPLTNIKGYLEAIRDGVAQPDEATIGVLYEQTNHLSQLVEDLRLLALADAGRLPLYKEVARLDLLAEDAVMAFRPRAAERGVQLTVTATPGLPLVDIDRTRVRQVVVNLVENALTHTPKDGRVTVTVDSPGTGRVRLTVEDTGRGIPEGQLEKIFDQFYRTDPSRARSTGGAGLGLTIVKRLVEAHGGSIKAESAGPGAGARFVIDFPAAGVPASR